MIGVVVWSSKTREQAVIWCDDHAALAYLAGRADFADAATWPEPGDMVRLESETRGEVRYAREVRPLDEAPRRSLPELLKREQQPARHHLSLVHDGGEVAPAPVAAVPAAGMRAADGRPKLVAAAAN